MTPLDYDKGILLINDESKLSVGELFRYTITVDKDELESQGLMTNELILQFKNTDSAFLRPVYLTGPYSFYIDVRPHNYNEWCKFSDEEIQYECDVKPDDTFKAFLKLNKNSRIGDTKTYSWKVDVICQLAVMVVPMVSFHLCLGTNDEIVEEGIKNPQLSLKVIRGFSYKKWDKNSLWNLPPIFPKKAVHLVIITHGIFSNIACDMLYIKDKIEEATFNTEESHNPNIIVRGYMGNIGKSHRGIIYLGKRVASYIIETYDKLKVKYQLDKISFVGHSLGGPVQAFAIHYISIMRPDIFDEKNGLKPINFITLASPYLGVIGDFPKFVSLALDIGALGITGRDLNLKTNALFSRGNLIDETTSRCKYEPILEVIPKYSAKPIFEKFINRTIYANVVHDGIVPLRTAALLYLDWQGLNYVQNIRKQLGNKDDLADAQNKSDIITAEIPMEKIDKKSSIQRLMKKKIFNRKNKIYLRTQTKLFNEKGELEKRETQNDFIPPPKASTLLSAASVIIAALPTQDYLTDPSSREDKIFHDKVYFPNELPPAHYTNRTLFKKLIYPNDKIHRIQESIARLWQETMSWRKVLVDLKPDSHNNIVVRRRFVNSFGWIVIDHLVKEHFSSKISNDH